jgi:hypothetical protein
MAKKPKKRMSPAECFREGRHLSSVRERLRFGLVFVEHGKRYPAMDALFTAANALDVHVRYAADSTAEEIRSLAKTLNRGPALDVQAKIEVLIKKTEELIRKAERACGDRAQ